MGTQKQPGMSVGGQHGLLHGLQTDKGVPPVVGFHGAAEPFRWSAGLQTVNTKQAAPQLTYVFIYLFLHTAAICPSLSLEPKKLEVNCFSQIRTELSDQQSASASALDITYFFPDSDAG